MRWIVIRNPLKSERVQKTDLKLWLSAVRALSRLKADKAAIRLINKALAQHPNQPDLYFEAGRVYLRQGQFDKSVWHFKKANPALEPSNFVSWLEELVNEQNEGIVADRGSVLCALSIWYLQTGDPNRALKYLSPPYLHRSFPGALNIKGLCLLALGRYTQAQQAFEVAAQTGGGSEILYNAGIACLKLKQYDRALKYFEQAQQRGLAGSDLMNNKGFSLYYLNRLEEAALCYEMALNLAPKDQVILGNLAACCEKQGRLTEALDHYREAIRLDPFDPALRNNFALCLQSAGRYSEALQQHDRTLELDSDLSYICNRAICLYRMGETDEALAVYDELLSANPTESSVWGLRAELLMSLGRTTDATESLNRSLGLTG